MQHGHQVLVRLREMIASGQLQPGERIIEIPTAELLGVSRLPVRLALRILEQEGLLEKLPRRGFAVRKITTQDFLGALDVRGVLEGLAARQAAEKGLSAENVQALEQALAQIDAMFEDDAFEVTHIEHYHRVNMLFHETILEASGNAAIKLALTKVESLPFASVQSLVVDTRNMVAERKRLLYAHLQHHAILGAIKAGQGARAEALMKEHANSPILFNDLLKGFSENAEGVQVIQTPSLPHEDTQSS
ncbi:MULTISPECIES: GntR family transcriptional regulator [Vitreoscilla]|uniref:GntR family transcriptional regulator n=1 Tax=Vitreoscilla stercoraria TaxID=61 RepID=A0ABY4E9U2_VITST|nr:MULTISPECIES: GntR family transcriptional regulator [Vitreoscilla]AUZ06116.1 GntR family transcriptional regulator [Vitreoscilla sp. C1]UOO92521.1 GntR family transcriptional regulator [Vitreoscilla stercoraria]